MSNFVDLLLQRGKESPDRQAFAWSSDGENIERIISFDSLEFIIGFFSVIFAGLMAVPCFPVNQINQRVQTNGTTRSLGIQQYIAVKNSDAISVQRQLWDIIESNDKTASLLEEQSSFQISNIIQPHPAHWLRALSKNQIDVTCASSSMIEMSVKLVQYADLLNNQFNINDIIDLSSVRSILCISSEQIDPWAIVALYNRYGQHFTPTTFTNPLFQSKSKSSLQDNHFTNNLNTNIIPLPNYKLPRNSIVFCYSLSEITSLFCVSQRRVHVDGIMSICCRLINSSQLLNVSCGQPYKEGIVSITRIAQIEKQKDLLRSTLDAQLPPYQEVPDGQIGEIWIKQSIDTSSPSGYWNKKKNNLLYLQDIGQREDIELKEEGINVNEEIIENKQQQTFGLYLSGGKGPFIRTGDIGVFIINDEGRRELIICGRYIYFNRCFYLIKLLMYLLVL
ncbi:MAG: hypothetical protein EZS28_014273 [Streblomastix strix]|uniref:AMP-dependent synthetase/ligase domain-containing protein n=1 Tax=Streblomastix strix TaxID=222440 RepID=A0A5J4W609_9EUKA|nr:MAG: hypothetical protein EZS28_014273 [Streblomastix strix]